MPAKPAHVKPTTSETRSGRVCMCILLLITAEVGSPAAHVLGIRIARIHDLWQDLKTSIRIWDIHENVVVNVFIQTFMYV